MNFAINPFQAALGAEVVGLDLTQALEGSTLTRVTQALHDHLVLVFRDARISPAQHVALSRRFGVLQQHVLKQFAHPDQPEVLIVSNVIENGKPIGLGDAGRDWHSDLSYMPKPSMGSLLHAQEMPKRDGHTLFANMYAALDTLAQADRAAVSSHRAVHSYVYRYERLRAQDQWRAPLTAQQIEQVPPVSHPAARTHPGTRRKALFVSEGFTSHFEDMPADESADLLHRVTAHSSRTSNVYTHQWQPHDLVFWDNRSTIHYAAVVPPPARRTLYRTTVEGDVPY